MTKLFVFAGTSVGALSIFGVLWLTFWRDHAPHHNVHFFFDPQDLFREDPTPKARKLPLSAAIATFEPLLKHYLGVTQIIITVAAASIAFGGSEHSSEHPMVNIAKLLLAWSIVFGVFFCALLLWRYDEYGQNMRSYTLRWYSTIFACGFSCLLCFMIGYLIWGWALL